MHDFLNITFKNLAPYTLIYSGNALFFNLLGVFKEALIIAIIVETRICKAALKFITRMIFWN
jgi:hypothetical protein